jgi:hypothetical protein
MALSTILMVATTVTIFAIERSRTEGLGDF